MYSCVDKLLMPDPCSTTGVRDPVTSALQIVIGKRVSLDIARVKWRRDLKSATSTRYAASFVG